MVNLVSKVNSYPIPRVDYCIDQPDNAMFVSKFDLLKGYWQDLITERAIDICVFVMPISRYRFKVMKNAPSTFTRLRDKLIGSLQKCLVYKYDVVYSDNFDEHVLIIR